MTNTTQNTSGGTRRWWIDLGIFLLETVAVILLVLVVGWLLMQWAAHAGHIAK